MCVQVLRVTLDKESNGLLFYDCNHILLAVAAQEPAERSSSQENAGQALIVLQGLVELLEVDVSES